MKVLVTGVNGQLGYDVVKELLGRGDTVIGTDLPGNDPFNDILPDGRKYEFLGMDITREKDVYEKINSFKPDSIIHCAAWTAVDAAELEENHEKVTAINSLGTYYLSKAANMVNAKMLYISTDYVFNDNTDKPLDPDNKSFDPINVYGKSKLDGEFAVTSSLDKYFIVRTEWVFGSHGKNFVKTMLRVGEKNDTVRVVNDQIGTPTYTVDLARFIVDLIKTDKYGFYHASNEGPYISWFDFTREIYRQVGLKTIVIPVTTEEYGLSTAKRPNNSRFNKQKIIREGFEPLPDWKDALRRYLSEISAV